MTVVNTHGNNAMSSGKVYDSLPLQVRGHFVANDKSVVVKPLNIVVAKAGDMKPKHVRSLLSLGESSNDDDDPFAALDITERDAAWVKQSTMWAMYAPSSFCEFVKANKCAGVIDVYSYDAMKKCQDRVSSYEWIEKFGSSLTRTLGYVLVAGL